MLGLLREANSARIPSHQIPESTHSYYLSTAGILRLTFLIHTAQYYGEIEVHLSSNQRLWPSVHSLLQSQVPLRADPKWR